MRIIGGKYKGARLSPPQGLPVRPTTDMAREALFNILQHRIDLGSGGIHALDLFSGTGGVSLELASRGAKSVVAVDQHFKCVRFLADAARRLEIEGIRTVKADVFAYLDRCQDKFDFIFADPPYDMDRLTALPGLIFDKELLAPHGILVLEFPSTLKLPASPTEPEIRKYGHSSFAIYEPGLQ